MCNALCTPLVIPVVQSHATLLQGLKVFHKDKAKWSFLQKYYHKGVFYMDEDSIKDKQDARLKAYDEATGRFCTHTIVFSHTHFPFHSPHRRGCGGQSRAAKGYAS